MRGYWSLLFLGCFGCSEELFDPGEGVLTSGQEPDVWSVDPAPTNARLETEDQAGNRSTLFERPAPLTHFSFGEGGTTRFVVSGLDATDVVRVRARTLALSPAGLATVRLPVFVSRTDTFARPPGNLVTDQGERSPYAFVGGRYVLMAGGAAGDRAQLDGYDFGAWLPLEPPPPLSCGSPPCRVRSLAVVSDTLALVMGDNWAMSLDIDTGTIVDLTNTRPDGLAAWSDVAGGRTVIASDGTSFIVGATRTDSASRTVIRVKNDGTFSALSLTAPRLEAAAAWVDGIGLVVVGGDAQAAGAERLPAGADAFVALPFAPDPTHGAGLVATADGNVIRSGGRDAKGAYAETAVFSLGCGTSCTPSTKGPSAELDHATAFRAASDAEPDAILVVGDDASGSTIAKLLGATSTDVPLREPRSGAVAFLGPTGHVCIAGGTLADQTPATSLELFIR